MAPTPAPPHRPTLSTPPLRQGCSSVLYFEARKHKDLYLWVAKAPGGPSAKFHVTNGGGDARCRACACCC